MQLQTLLAAMQQQPQQPIHSNILEQIRALVPQASLVLGYLLSPAHYHWTPSGCCACINLCADCAAKANSLNSTASASSTTVHSTAGVNHTSILSQRRGAPQDIPFCMLGVHSMTTLECYTGEATVHVSAQFSSEARTDSREPSIHGSTATTLNASCALLAAGQNAHAPPFCRPDPRAQVVEYCSIEYQGSILLLSAGSVPAPAGEAVRPKRRGQCPSATSQAILASAATFRRGPAIASFAGVQYSLRGHMCAMSLSSVVGRAAMPYLAESSQQGAVRPDDTHGEVYMCGIAYLQSVRRMARAAFGPDSGLSEEVETALMELADEWITSTLTLGCGAARKRKSAVLMPEHVAKSLEPLWCVLGVPLICDCYRQLYSGWKANMDTLPCTFRECKGYGPWE